MTPSPRAAAASPAPIAADLTPVERKAQALQRLQASREHLIVQLYPAPEEPSTAASGGSPSTDFLSALAARIGRQGLARGVWGALRHGARRWWRRQPWHGSVDLVGQAVGQEVRPLVRRHPWAAVALGIAAGAGLVLLKPWLMPAVRGRMRPWRQNLGQMLWSQLSQAPVQMALAGALAAWINERAPSADRPAEPSSPSHPPQ